MSDHKSPPDRAFKGPHAAQAADAGAPGLLPADQADPDDARLDGILPLGISPLAPRGVGRPKGAKNRRTDLVAAYLVERFGDPLTATMSIVGMPVDQLIEKLRTVASDRGMKLGASVMDIVRFQHQCAVDALPYIHAKRAAETFAGDPVLPVLGVGGFAAGPVLEGAANSMEDELERRMQQAKQVQEVSQTPPEVSHDEMSHDERNPDEH